MIEISEPESLPTILTGPLLRHVAPERFVLWLVCSRPNTLIVRYYWNGNEPQEHTFTTGHAGHLQIGERAHLHLLDITPPSPLPYDEWIHYDIGVVEGDSTAWLATTLPTLLYPDASSPRFVLRSRLIEVLHGSCRKPHGDGRDGLVMVDQHLAKTQSELPAQQQPALLMLTGDQVYVDDVAGPMLQAIQHVITQLGLYQETLSGASICSSEELRNRHYFRRHELLPDNAVNSTLRERFFFSARKPIFTTANADNHLISLAEMLAQYLLVWSPTLWQLFSLETPPLEPELQQRYHEQLPVIEHFAAELSLVQRALAHIPTYMIFDDHDVTDDWNLSRDWQESAYNHPFSRRIIGNALLSYTLCQGWGNAPDHFPPQLIQTLRDFFTESGCTSHDSVVEAILNFDHWHYQLNTQPKMVILDTRTHRWWSEKKPSHPSGLMDWEALSDMQQALLGEPAVLLISPAPIFGVKLIEVIQSIFTQFGYALTVDAENWMAHPEAASAILNIFRHTKTPHNFVILSGDVHYSFAYDVELRHYKQGPAIWQITSSGIKNEFPHTLLRVFDRCNRWLFASASPLNWLTRRRSMRIRQRRPSEYSKRYRHQRLVNGSGIGRLVLDEQGVPQQIEILLSQGEAVHFVEGYERDWL